MAPRGYIVSEYRAERLHSSGKCSDGVQLWWIRLGREDAIRRPSAWKRYGPSSWGSRAPDGSDGRHETAIPQLKLYRYSHPTEPTYVLQEPAVYVVVQGRKQVMLGDETYVYDRSQYLAVSVDITCRGERL